MASWAAGLVVAPSAPHAHASTSAVHAFYAAHHGSAFLQAYLVDGMAAAAFVVFAISVSRTFTGAVSWSGVPSTLAVSSVALAGVSVLLVGLYAAVDHQLGRNGTSLLKAIGGAEGLRLLALAAVVAAVSATVGQDPAVPRPVHRTGVIAIPMLAVGSLDYVAGGPLFFAGRAVALLAILMWVAALSVVLLQARHA